MHFLLLALCLTATASLGICMEHACRAIKPCRCQGDQFRIQVNCHGTTLNTTQICNLCRKIKDVGILDLSQTNFSDIPSRCFQECHDLVQLSLAKNNICKLKSDTFVGLTKLRSLNLNGNRLVGNNGEITDPKFFREIKNLQTLDIGRNIHEKNKTAFNVYLSNVDGKAISNLRNIYLDGLPNSVFGAQFLQLKYLKQIYFAGDIFGGNCFILNLTNKSFENVPHVTHLDLSACNLYTIEAGTFESLTELRYLNLSNNMALGFTTLRNVSYGLQTTRIYELDYSKVYKTFGLTVQLNRCDVWFLQNTSLKILWLKSNRIGAIETDALRLLPGSLEILHVEDNSLSFGPYALQTGCLNNLKTIELSGQETTHCMRLYNAELDIEEHKNDTSGGCLIHNLPRRPNCPSLENKAVAPWRFTFPISLQTINYRSSNLKAYPLSNQPYLLDLGVERPIRVKNKLMHMDLSNNILYSWDHAFLKADYLLSLNLSNNFCTNVSSSFFSTFPSLQSLDASNNKLGPHLANDTEGSTFKYLRNIKYLNLSNNWIMFLPRKVFINTGNIESLDLSFNRLSKINFDFKTLTSLSHIYLQQNEISTLPLNFLKQLEHHSREEMRKVTIDLSNNPIAATCENLEFLEWMMINSRFFHNLKLYRFYKNDPKGRVAVSYEVLKESFSIFKNSCRSYLSIIIVSTVFISIFISIVIFGLIYRYRWRLRCFYYVAKSRYHGYFPLADTAAPREFQYDVFVAYAVEDYRFVTGEMFRNLQEAELSVCLHQKDFLPGYDIAENILQAIRSSRVTVVVLSNQFLLSKWCMYEFNMARMEGIYSRDGKNIILVVIYEEINLRYISEEMREILESRSYLTVPEDKTEMPYFWHILIQAIESAST